MADVLLTALWICVAFAALSLFVVIGLTVTDRSPKRKETNMNELQKIKKDIENGALPRQEVPSFIIWLIAKGFWGLFLFIVFVGLLISLS